MNSANIPASKVQAPITDAQTILLASGVSQQDVQKIVADMQAMAAEAQKNASAVSHSAGTKSSATPAGLPGRKRGR